MTVERLEGIRRVFVDTSAFFAALNGRDANHATALSILNRLASEPSQLITTNFVLAECHALIVRRVGRRPALEFLDNIEDGSTNIIRVSNEDEERARALLRRYDDKDFSLTDATSFVVMERLSLRQALSFDRDFAQYGLDILKG